MSGRLALMVLSVLKGKSHNTVMFLCSTTAGGRVMILPVFSLGLDSIMFAEAPMEVVPYTIMAFYIFIGG